MGQAYSVLLVAMGILLMISFAKENKIFLLAGGFFIFFGVWRIADSMTAVDLQAGPYGVALKVISTAVLIILLVAFGRRYRRESRQQKQVQDVGKEKDQGE